MFEFNFDYLLKDDLLPGSPAHTSDSEYTLNSNGFRTKEFSDVDWGESVVIFGDSCVFGFGVDPEETLSAWLEVLINRPVLNLGSSGCSNLFTMYNNMRLLSKYNPYAVINIWTSPERTTTFRKHSEGCHQSYVTHWGNWNHTYKPYTDFWMKEEFNYMTHTKLIIDTCQLLNKDNRYLNYELPPTNLPGRARDGSHPDGAYYFMQAEKIHKDFVKNEW